MRNDWILATIAYPLSRFFFPVLTYGRISVSPWDSRASTAWRVKRIGGAKIELGPDLAGLLVCGVVAMETFSLINAIPFLQALLTLP